MCVSELQNYGTLLMCAEVEPYCDASTAPTLANANSPLTVTTVSDTTYATATHYSSFTAPLIQCVYDDYANSTE